MRFRRVVDSVYRSQAVDWSGVAVDGGYGDQAHLVHEFRAFAGMTPTAFMAARGPYPNHLPLD
jgi:AraC-like DNA-binding protein